MRSMGEVAAQLTEGVATRTGAWGHHRRLLAPVFVATPSVAFGATFPTLRVGKGPTADAAQAATPASR